MGSVNSKKSKTIFRYVNKGESGVYESSVPTISKGLVRVAYTKSVRKAVVVRNRIGRRLWGKYWNAVLSGFIDTIKSDTLSVAIVKKGSTSVVVYRDLITTTQQTKSFSLKKYGNEAENLAKEYANKITQQRADQLAQWDRKIIRKTRK